MSRPGWKKRPITFDDDTTQTRFEDGLFQGAREFQRRTNSGQIVASISGRLFAVNVEDGYTCTELPVPDLLSPPRPKVWMEQAEDFLIVQDGRSAPLIDDGNSVRRANQVAPPKEIPVGTCLLYALGRLWTALPDGKSFMAGNLVYGEDGTPAYSGRDSVLKFSENQFYNGGGAFAVPFNAGNITAIKAIANLDTSLGQGPVQVFTELGVFSVNAPFDRTTWQNLQYPIQTISLLASGATSQEGAALVNGDIWFRASDGIRSFQIARRDFGAWVNTPVSSEMRFVLKDDDVNLLDHASAMVFDNRLLTTAAPSRVNDHGIVWRGVIALDFNNVSGITQRSTPIYDGLWTGLRVLQLVPYKSRCFLFVLNPDDEVELWELSLADPFDNMTVSPTRIASFIDTPLFGFEDQGMDRKELSTGDVWFSDLRGLVTFTAKFRPDNHPDFIPWHSWSIDAKNESCAVDCDNPPLSLQPQYRTRQRLPLPSGACNAKDRATFRHCYEAQMRLAWTGHARVDRVRVIAHQEQESSLPFCTPSEATDTTGITGCEQDVFAYSSA